MTFVDINNLGSSFFSSAHGWVGARTRTEFSATKIKKSFRLCEGAAGGGGEGEESRRARAMGWEAARLCASREAKPAKIVSLIEKEICARPLKEKEIFASFASRRQAASRWAGSLSEIRRISLKHCSNFVQKTPQQQRFIHISQKYQKITSEEKSFSR